MVRSRCPQDSDFPNCDWKIANRLAHQVGISQWEDRAEDDALN